MENKYIINESELIDLLAAYHYANCLESEGVDNWGKFESFEDKAKDDLKYYTKIEV